MESSPEWDFDVLGLCCRIREAVDQEGKINEQQCLLVKLLADCIQRYMEIWITLCGEEVWWNLRKELFRVLESALQLIILSGQKNSSADIALVVLGFKGELNEIIDDARVYAQMINRFILNFPNPLHNVEEQQNYVENLRIQVVSDCNSLQSSIETAYQQDKKTLIRNWDLSNNCWHPWPHIQAKIGRSTNLDRMIFNKVLSKYEGISIVFTRNMPSMRDVWQIRNQQGGKKSKGGYSAKLGYDYLLSTKESSVRRRWKLTPKSYRKLSSNIWKTYAAPKVSFFIWLLTRNGLPTNANLHTRKLSKPPLVQNCPLCGHRETSEHVFICPFVLPFWTWLNPILRKHITTIQNLIDAFCCKQTLHNTIFQLALWAIWKHRNRCIFQGKRGDLNWIKATFQMEVLGAAMAHRNLKKDDYDKAWDQLGSFQGAYHFFKFRLDCCFANDDCFLDYVPD